MEPLDHVEPVSRTFGHRRRTVRLSGLVRPDFIFKGYLKGVLAFVDEHWRMIHRAAGWGALRAFLLVRMFTVVRSS